MLLTDNDPVVLGAPATGGGGGGLTADQLTVATLDPTGFAPILNADMVLTYSSADRKVTLTSVCNAYCKGNLVAVPEGWESPAHADVTGTYYLRYDCATKQFLYDTAPWAWQDLQVAYTQYDAVSKIGRTVREMHSTAPWAWHRNDHYNIGTTRISGGDVTGLVLNSTTTADRRPSVSACAVRDEDIDSVITALPAGSYTQRFLAGAGATRSFVFGAGDIVKVTGSQPLYNQWNGSEWVDTPMAVGNYAKLFLVAIPMASDSDSQAIRYMWVQPQSSSGTLSVIQSVTPNSITHGASALLASEFVFIEEIIIRYIGGNWSIFSQSKLTGSRILQVGSPSGAYLSSVSTDSSLTGNGTMGSPLSAAALTGQAAPTTATEGYLGQVVFDTEGNRWELINIVDESYIWSTGEKSQEITGIGTAISTTTKTVLLSSNTDFTQSEPLGISDRIVRYVCNPSNTGVHKVGAIPLLPGDVLVRQYMGSSWVTVDKYTRPLYSKLTLSVNQTTNLTTGELVRFDEQVGDSSVLPLAGFGITVKRGAVWVVDAQIRALGATGLARADFYISDSELTTYGEPCGSVPVTGSTVLVGVNTIKVFIDATLWDSDRIVTLNIGSLTSGTLATIYADSGTQLVVKRYR